MSETCIDPDIPGHALSFQFVRARGAGGQHVNKASTAVELKVRLGATTLPEPVRARLRRLAGSRINRRDELVIFADRHRSQLRNREDALQRLAALLRQARSTPKKRVPTRPSRSQKEARRDQKRRQGQTKRLRGKPTLD